MCLTSKENNTGHRRVDKKVNPLNQTKRNQHLFLIKTSISLFVQKCFVRSYCLQNFENVVNLKNIYHQRKDIKVNKY